MSTHLQRIGKYELLLRLSRSNIAEVWKAYDMQERSTVALKFFHANVKTDADFASRFAREVQTIAALRHPNIVPIRACDVLPAQTQEDTLALLVMDYVAEGQSLADYIRITARAGKFAQGADLLHLFTGISMAVDAAHRAGVIHGNIKPGNILLQKRDDSPGKFGEPMLTDFGLSRLLGSSMRAQVHSSLEATLYISPEQARGNPANERSDIYSLGIILYEMCTGVLPFQGNRPVSLLMQHISASPTPPAFVNPSIHPLLNIVILRCLAKDPAERFPNAASLTAGLARGLNLPIPEDLGHIAYRTDAQHSLGEFHLSPGSSPGILPSTTSWPGIPAVPAYTSQNGALPQNPQTSPLPWDNRKKRSSGRYFALITLLLSVLVGATLGTVLLLIPKPALVKNPLVGHAFFTSSEQVNGTTNQGVNDELQIDLQHMTGTSPGKSYYAWLLGDRNQSESAPIFLGKVSVDQQGNVHFLYRGDQKHTNLLEFTSRFLITEADANVTPSNPSPDFSTWDYYAEIPQVAIPGDKLHFSMLDHFRHLLAESPELKARSLHGGLVFWLLQNTRKVLGCANSAKDSWGRQDVAAIRNQLNCVLDYLDGTGFVHKDEPSVGPLLADVRNAQIPLLGPVPKSPDPPGYNYDEETPPGYVYLIDLHLNGAILSPQATSDQHKLAGQINTAIDKLKSLLETVQLDAKLLVHLTNAQLLQISPLTILNDMVTQAQFAYAGQPDPSSGATNGGTLWIYNNFERLTSFDVKVFSGP